MHDTPSAIRDMLHHQRDAIRDMRRRPGEDWRKPCPHSSPHSSVWTLTNTLTCNLTLCSGGDAHH